MVIIDYRNYVLTIHRQLKLFSRSWHKECNKITKIAPYSDMAHEQGVIIEYISTFIKFTDRHIDIMFVHSYFVNQCRESN